MARTPLSTIAGFSVRYPWLSLAIGLGLCVLSALGALRVNIQTNVASLLPKGTPVLDRFADLERVFGSADLLLFAIDSAELPDDPAALAAHQKARGELAAVIAAKVDDWSWDPPGAEPHENMVSAVLGAPSETLRSARDDMLLANTWLFFGDQVPGTTADHITDPSETSPLDSMLPWLTKPERLAKRVERPSPTVLPKWQSRDPIGWWKDLFIPWWQQRLSGDGPLQEQNGFLVTRDGQSHVLIVNPVRQSQDSTFCDAVVARATELTDWLTAQTTPDATGVVAHPEWRGLSISSVGGYFVAYRDYHSATSSALITAVTSLIGVMLLFALVYRSLSLAGMIGVCLIPAIAASLGLSAILLGGELSMIVSGFAAILIGLGVDFFIHIYNAYGWSLGRLLHERRMDFEDDDQPWLEPNRAERCQLRGQAAVEAIDTVGGGLVAAAATSIATFLILLLSHYKGLQELGAVCGMGLLLILVMALLAAPAFLTLAGGMKTRPSKLMQRFAGFLLRRPVPFAVALIILVASSVGYLSTRDELFVFDRDPRNLRPAEDVFYESQMAAVKRLGLKSSGHFLLIRSEDQAALVTTARGLVDKLAVLRDPVEAVSANATPLVLEPGIPQTLTVSELPAGTIIDGRRQAWVDGQLLLSESQKDGVLFNLTTTGDEPLTIAPGSAITLGAAVERLPRELLWFAPPGQQLINLERLRDEVDWDAVATVLEALDAGSREKRAPFLADLAAMRERVESQRPLLPDELMNSPLRDVVGMVYRQDGDQSYLRMEVALTRMDSDGLVALYDYLGLDQHGTGIDGPVTYGTAGPPSIAVSIQELLEVDFERMGLLALGTTVLLIIICLRSVKGSIQALCSLLGGLIVCLACIHLVGQTWNLMNVAIVPLIIGIGIDNGIHFVHALRHTHLGGVAAVRQAFVEVGHPIIMTALTSVVGFASLFLNDFQGMQSCGRTAVIGILSCLVVAVISLPLLALLHAHRHATRSYRAKPSAD